MSAAAKEPIAVPALDLKAQYQTIRDEIEPVVRAVPRTRKVAIFSGGFDPPTAKYDNNCSRP